MKSVGETMAIGRTFKEAFQKGLRGLEIGRFGLGADGKGLPDSFDGSDRALESALRRPTTDRIFYVKHALEVGRSIEEIYELTGIDPWFLANMKELVETERELEREVALLMDCSEERQPDSQLAKRLKSAKRMGFSDFQLATLTNRAEGRTSDHVWTDLDVRRLRQDLGIHAVFNAWIRVRVSSRPTRLISTRRSTPRSVSGRTSRRSTRIANGS
jgi:carbamoyl-phosphate synthase large subunit